MPRLLPYADTVDASYLLKAKAMLYTELGNNSDTAMSLHPRVLVMAAECSPAPLLAPQSVASKVGDAQNNYTLGQRRAITLEYQRGSRLSAMAVAEVARLAIPERTEALDSMGRALRRRRVEVVRAMEDVNAKRRIVQTDEAFADMLLGLQK